MDNSQQLAIFAELAMINLFTNETTQSNFVIDDIAFELIATSQLQSSSGYQGYAYKNLTTGEIIVVHEGSINPFLDFWNNLSEIENDWIGANGSTLTDNLTTQFISAKNFLESVKTNNTNATIIQVGQSLGGTLCELLGALASNQNIDTYTFNSLGAGNLLNELIADGNILSGNYTNIYNLTYNNEFVSKINPHIGNVYKANYEETNGGIYKFHSIETHYQNGLLTYELVEDYFSIMDAIIDGANLVLDYVNNKIVLKLNYYGVISDEQLNSYIEALNDNDFLNQDVFVGQISMNNDLYVIKPYDTIWDIANKFGISENALIEANPWLSDRYSEDKTFALIKPSEQIIIPQDSIKGTNSSNVTKYLNDAINGNITTDTIAPDNVTLPASGSQENPTVQHYTSKPSMLSQEDIFYLAVAEDNYEAFKTLLPQFDKNTFETIRAIILSPSNIGKFTQNLNNITIPTG